MRQHNYRSCNIQIPATVTWQSVTFGLHYSICNEPNEFCQLYYCALNSTLCAILWNMLTNACVLDFDIERGWHEHILPGRALYIKINNTIPIPIVAHLWWPASTHQHHWCLASSNSAIAISTWKHYHRVPCCYWQQSICGTVSVKKELLFKSLVPCNNYRSVIWGHMLRIKFMLISCEIAPGECHKTFWW